MSVKTQSQDAKPGCPAYILESHTKPRTLKNGLEEFPGKLGCFLGHGNCPRKSDGLLGTIIARNRSRFVVF